MSKKSIPTFDEALDAHENGGEKAAKKEAAKRAKYQQIKTQKEKLENDIYNTEQKLQKSYFDPQSDTVRLHLDLQILQKEFEACDEIMKALFPNGITKAVPAATA